MQSHPSWVRGLKQMQMALNQQQNEVAPLVGAWIETAKLAYEQTRGQSHPSWVRGLKHRKKRLYDKVIRSHPSWVRGLKHYHK